MGGNPARNGRVAEVGPTSAQLAWFTGPGSTFVGQAVVEGDLVVRHSLSVDPNRKMVYGLELCCGPGFQRFLPTPRRETA